MTRFPRLAAATLVLAVAASVTPAPSSAGTDPAVGAGFARPARLVDIGGRRLALNCTGTGSPTVIFESPLGAAGWDWWAVQPKVAATTRACTHDRAGLGFSDPSPRSAGAAEAVDDLHALLKAAGIAPPYVIVGSSFGGAVAQLYAWRYPGEVSGLVLAEPMHEDGLRRPDALTGGAMSKGEADTLAFGEACAAQAARGFDPKSAAWSDCIGGPDPSLPPAVAAVDLARRLTPAWWQALQAERAALPRARAQLETARQPFQDLPMVVLVRGTSPYLVPGQPQSDTNRAVEAANLSLLGALAKQSTRGELRVVAGSGHVIEETHPEALVSAVEDLLAKARR